MTEAIQFETIVDRGLIRIPEHLVKTVPVSVKVTLTPMGDPHIKAGVKSKAGELSSDDFAALSIDTGNWTFDREEANER